uniref:GUN4-like domain-containing protein n=1 Tax=Vertebrata lanosa TaxID=1261582 RepID=A0A0B5W3Q8_9FLOR|nr:hypothetical protein [Vertebrata lanosa]AJH66045.1 hypothetical protein [Vertebrata lanosa]
MTMNFFEKFMKKTKGNKEYIEQEIKAIFSKSDHIVSNDTEKRLDNILEDKVGKEMILSNIIKRNTKVVNNPDITDGLIYQKILKSQDNTCVQRLLFSLPNGIIKLKKSEKINYQPLQNLLIKQNFQEADKLTQTYLCKLVEIETKNSKNWLYFTDIQFIPKTDLFQIDLLWKIYSKGKFGFSVQKEIWVKYNEQWDKLWEKINWLKIENGIMKRYPQEFTWTTDAPKGHLPLFNQLRGTQTLFYLFNSIDW